MKQRRILAFALASGIFALDRLTKIWIEASLHMHESIPVVPGFFAITRTENPGAAFSLLAGAPAGFRSVVLIGISMVLLVFIAGMLWRLPPADRVSRVAFSLLLGGALGNLYDRIARGAVTDFLDLYAGEWHWPTFNVADSAITTGAGLLLLELLRSRQGAPRAHGAGAPPSKAS